MTVTTAGRIVSAAYLNLAGIYLGRALESRSSAEFPYVLVESGQPILQAAKAWISRAETVEGVPSRAACGRLRVDFADMDWASAASVITRQSCVDASLNVRQAPWLALEGLAQHQAGEQQTARLTLRRALVAGSTIFAPSLPPWSELAELQSNGTDFSQDHADGPQFYTSRSADGAAVRPAQAIAPDWELVGHDFSAAKSRASLPLTVRLYWRPMSTNARADPEWRVEDGLWIQEVESINMLPDGGFEWSVDGPGAWSLPSGMSEVTVGERGDAATHMLVVKTNPQEGGAIVSSPVMPLVGDCAFLVGAWIKTGADARPAVSVVWAGLQDRAERRAFSDLVGPAPNLPWTPVSQLVEPLPEARGVSLYFSNWNRSSEGDVNFAVDDAFLLPVPLSGRSISCTPIVRREPQ